MGSCLRTELLCAIASCGLMVRTRRDVSQRHPQALLLNHGFYGSCWAVNLQLPPLAPLGRKHPALGRADAPERKVLHPPRMELVPRRAPGPAAKAELQDLGSCSSTRQWSCCWVRASSCCTAPLWLWRGVFSTLLMVEGAGGRAGALRDTGMFMVLFCCGCYPEVCGPLTVMVLLPPSLN